MLNFLKELWSILVEHFSYNEQPLSLHNEPQVFPPVEPQNPVNQTKKQLTVVNKDWLDRLIPGLIYAESRGDVNCIGDKNIPESKGGPAYGILQIRSGVRSQVNVLWGKDYKGQDLLGDTGAELSRLMCRAYFLSIAPQYKSWKASLSAGISLEETAAKVWNGGPGAYLQSKKKGYEKYAAGLEMYWQTVDAHRIK